MSAPDIVARLRAFGTPTSCGTVLATMAEAADEIRDLRVALAWLVGLEIDRPSDYREQKPMAMLCARKVLGIEATKSN